MKSKDEHRWITGHRECLHTFDQGEFKILDGVQSFRGIVYCLTTRHCFLGNSSRIIIWIFVENEIIGML